MSTIETTENITSAAAARAASKSKKNLGRIRSLLGNVPYFGYFLVIFMIIEYSVEDVNAVFLTLGYSKLSAVLVLCGLAFFILIADLTRIARPNVNKIWNLIGMAGVAMLYLLLYAVGLVIVLNGGTLNLMRIFSTSEFLLFTAATVAESIGAAIILAHTLQRTVDMSNSDINERDH